MQQASNPLATQGGTLDIAFRQAGPDDFTAIVDLLDSDEISRARHAGSERSIDTMRAAFDEIAADPNNELWVAVARSGAVLASLQLTFIPGLTGNGMRRALVEAVRVDPATRGRGIGSALMQRVIERARQRGCGLVQLTTDRRRDAAQRFYARLGFEPSHVGMKLRLQALPG